MAPISCARVARAAPLAAIASILGCAASAAPPVAAHQAVSPPSFEWSTLAPLPDALGVAGAYSGVSKGALIVAGGANFPDGPPWAGHAKAWHNAGFISADGSSWERVDNALLSARGYGAAVTLRNEVICIGGADATRHYADVVALRSENGRLVRSTLPPLPTPLAYCAAAAIGDVIYVAGGTTSPTATAAEKRFLSINLADREPAWCELEPCPGPGRMLAVAASVDGAFYLASGASLAPDAAGKPVRTYLTDAYRYQPGGGWSRIADLPHSTAGAPTPAAPVGDKGFAIFGGDDGTKVSFEPKDQHPGFNHAVIAYDRQANAWTTIGEMPLAQVTTALVLWHGGYVVPTGEVRPAVRTPQVSFARVPGAAK